MVSRRNCYFAVNRWLRDYKRIHVHIGKAPRAHLSHLIFLRVKSRVLSRFSFSHPDLNGRLAGVALSYRYFTTTTVEMSIVQFSTLEIYPPPPATDDKLRLFLNPLVKTLSWLKFSSLSYILLHVRSLNSTSYPPIYDSPAPFPKNRWSINNYT